MLNSKYATIDHVQNQTSLKRCPSKRKHKYGIKELNRELGIEEHSGYSDEPQVRLETEEGQENAVYFGDDMMDLDNMEDITFVSDLISDHRQQAAETNPSELSFEEIEKFPLHTVPIKLTVFVVDTNFIISHLHMLESLRELNSVYGHQIVIPSMVIQELDGLKNSKKYTKADQSHEQNLGKLARAANDWIYRNLANLDSAVQGQRIHQRYNYTLTKDDAILDCCLYFENELDNFVVLLSNDKNLCLRALTERLLTISFRQGMTGELISSKVSEEKRSRFHNNVPQKEKKEFVDVPISPGPDDLDAIYAGAYNAFRQTVLDRVHQIMVDSYGDELEFISCGGKTLADLREAALLINSHFVSVFSEYFNKTPFRKEDWMHLPNELVNLPTKVSELKTFISFWSQVLESLYKNSPLHEKNSIKNFTDRWVHVCSSLNYRT